MDLEPFKEAVKHAAQNVNAEDELIGKFLQELVDRHEPHDNLIVVLDKLFDCVRRLTDVLQDPEGSRRADHYRGLAKETCADDEFEIDDNARVVCTDDGFAWVQGWVRIERSEEPS